MYVCVLLHLSQCYFGLSSEPVLTTFVAATAAAAELWRVVCRQKCSSEHAICTLV